MFLHLASLIAILLFMREKIKQILIGAYLYIIKKEKENKKDFFIIIYLIISTIPIVLVTLLLGKYLNFINNNIIIIGLLLIINGILLTTLEIKNKQNKIKIIDAIIIGIFQCIGILPGISRSGSCLLGANLRNIKKEDAAEYAFLLFIPASIGATILKIKNITEIVCSKDLLLYIVVFLITIFTTYCSLKVLLKLIKQGKIKIFSIYCVILGIIVIILNLKTYH